MRWYVWRRIFLLPLLPRRSIARSPRRESFLLVFAPPKPDGVQTVNDSFRNYAIGRICRINGRPLSAATTTEEEDARGRCFFSVRIAVFSFFFFSFSLYLFCGRASRAGENAAIIQLRRAASFIVTVTVEIARKRSDHDPPAVNGPFNKRVFATGRGVKENGSRR